MKPLTPRAPIRRRSLLLAGLVAGSAAVAACSSRGSAPPPPGPTAPVDRLRVNVFPGAATLALFAAQNQGFFAQEGLAVDVQNTNNSTDQRDGLARGAFDIAYAGVDNAVAMRTAGQDVVILSGGDNSINSFFVQPALSDVAQVRGKALAVDAPNTAYALQAIKILSNHGVQPGEYEIRQVGGTFQRVQAMLDDRTIAATMLNPPYSVQAGRQGLRNLGSVADLLGPYQGSGAFALRSWSNSHGDQVTRFLAAWVRGLRWATEPAHREASVALLGQQLELDPGLADATYSAVTDPRNGLARDAAFDPAGFAQLLALRAEIEHQWNGSAPPQDQFTDLRWYGQGVARVG